MPFHEPHYHPIHRLALELDALGRSMSIMGKEIYRDTQLEASGINWDVKMVLRYLAERGPQTIPQLARLHKTSRQHLADVVAHLLERGYVTMVANPRHKRSKLVQLSAPGSVLLEFTSQKLASICACLQGSVDLPALEATNQVVRQVRWALDSKKWRSFDNSPYRPSKP